MRKSTTAIVAAGALLAAGSTTAITTVTTGGTLDCSGGALSQGVIWPPDHKMVPLTIVGLTTDPTLMPVTVTIISIQQDEPVNALGSGNTAPDGTIVNSNSPSTPSTAYVRAERAGPGTGRIYFITFNAMDGSGNTCPAPVVLQAIVPHDQGQAYAPIDTGVQYDSTMVPP
jgi:hypothetical protein